MQLINIPGILETLHPKKNQDIDLENLTHGSKKLLWWTCKNKHEYQASIESRINAKKMIVRDCGFCGNRYVTNDNNLKFLFPDIAKEWHPNKNGNKQPQEFVAGSRVKVWWLCKNNHEWDATIVARTNKKGGTNCPFCSGNKVSNDNNLKFLFPDIAKEWHPNKNGNKQPQEFVAGSRVKVWWLCKNNHEWDTTIGARTAKRGGTNCPKCTHQTSRNELRLLAELSFVFKDIISRYRYKKKEIDIFIKSLSLGIEHDGSYWHKNKKNLDKEKNNFLKSNDLNIIRIRHYPLKKISVDDIILKESQFIKKENINDLLKIIINLKNKYIKNKEKDLIKKYLSKKEFINEDLFIKYLSYSPNPLPIHSAFHAASPIIKKEWHPTKNKPLTLRNFYKYSRHKAWWLCKNNHEWEAIIGSRMYYQPKCPECTNRKVGIDNNLEVVYPQIAKEWHPTKNEKLKPNEVTFRSKTIVWWLCENKHEWKGTVESRSSHNKIRKCKKCSYQNRRKIL
jgi:very-short-patch-repair endonuclease